MNEALDVSVLKRATESDGKLILDGECDWGESVKKKIW